MTRLNGRRRGAVTGLLAAGALLAACGGPAPTPSPTVAGGGPTPAPTVCPALVGCVSGPAATVPPTPRPPPATPLPLAGFQVASVTFVSADDGWALGTVGGSLALARTQDGGTTWTSLPPPPTAFITSGAMGWVDGVRFANQQDGWAYGSQLWVTHDGGSTWAQVVAPGLASSGQFPIQLETAAGSVYAAVVYPANTGVVIDSGPVAGSSLTMAPTPLQFGAGPVPNGQLVLQGSSAWLIENERDTISGARLQSGAWASWTPPCRAVGGSSAVLAASSPLDLLAVCALGFSTSQSPTEGVFVSTDGGGSFSQLATALPVGCVGSSALASPNASVAVVACSSGLTATFDGGASWSTVDGGVSDVADLGFTTASQGVAVAIDAAGTSYDATGTLLMTHDGGHTWTAVDISAEPSSAGPGSAGDPGTSPPGPEWCVTGRRGRVSSSRVERLGGAARPAWRAVPAESPDAAREEDRCHEADARFEMGRRPQSARARGAGRGVWGHHHPPHALPQRHRVGGADGFGIPLALAGCQRIPVRDRHPVDAGSDPHCRLRGRLGDLRLVPGRLGARHGGRRPGARPHPGRRHDLDQRDPAAHHLPLARGGRWG